LNLTATPRGRLCGKILQGTGIYTNTSAIGRWPEETENAMQEQSFRVMGNPKTERTSKNVRFAECEEKD